LRYESVQENYCYWGSGFVGTNLCQTLADRQIPFEIIDIKQSQRFPEKCKIGDVRDLQSLREAITGDVVVNLAAVHRDDIRDKSEYVRTNVNGAENVANVCSEKNIRKIVFTSSVAVYGFAEPGTDEAGAINPFNEYGKTKYQAEDKLRAWHSSGDNCSIPDDHISPLRSALFVARSVLRDIRDGARRC
jgi:nucleoside-diphosphate-sugar epimerase